MTGKYAAAVERGLKAEENRKAAEVADRAQRDRDRIFAYNENVDWMNDVFVPHLSEAEDQMKDRMTLSFVAPDRIEEATTFLPKLTIVLKFRQPISGSKTRAFELIGDESGLEITEPVGMRMLDSSTQKLQKISEPTEAWFEEWLLQAVENFSSECSK